MASKLGEFVECGICSGSGSLDAVNFWGVVVRLGCSACSGSGKYFKLASSLELRSPEKCSACSRILGECECFSVLRDLDFE